MLLIQIVPSSLYSFSHLDIFTTKYQQVVGIAFWYTHVGALIPLLLLIIDAYASHVYRSNIDIDLILGCVDIKGLKQEQLVSSPSTTHRFEGLLLSEMRTLYLGYLVCFTFLMRTKTRKKLVHSSHLSRLVPCNSWRELT